MTTTSPLLTFKFRKFPFSWHEEKIELALVQAVVLVEGTNPDASSTAYMMVAGRRGLHTVVYDTGTVFMGKTEPLVHEGRAFLNFIRRQAHGLVNLTAARRQYAINPVTLASLKSGRFSSTILSFKDGKSFRIPFREDKARYALYEKVCFG